MVVVLGYVHYATVTKQQDSKGDPTLDLTHESKVDPSRLNYTVLYILMEDCRGGSLENILDKAPTGLSHRPELLHKILVQSTSAFAFLHSNQRLHKDIKTLNIFLTNNWNVKVGDFGSTEVLIHGTTPAMGEMTELFIAPEFFSGTPHITDKFDV